MDQVMLLKIGNVSTGHYIIAHQKKNKAKNKSKELH